MSGGARVVPIDYQMDKDEMIRLLEQLNGVYIPGDTKQTYLDSEFLETVSKILVWA
jgi:uncharacterized protein YabN with tetrapyrrole methylase and pyrophosphatase domain